MSTDPPSEPARPPTDVTPASAESSDPTRLQVPARRGGWLGAPLLIGSVVGVVSLFVLTAVGRTWVAAPIPLTAVVTTLPYLYGAALVGLFGVWVVAPDRRAIPALLGSVLVVGCVLWGPVLASGGSEVQGEPVRVLVWNVRRLWGGPDGAFDPEACVVQTLRDAKADVIALQEVSARDVELLSRSLPLACVHTDYLGLGDEDDGGVAACAQGDRWELRDGAPAQFVPDHRWNYVFTEFGRGEQIFNLLSVHLQPYRLASGNLVRAGQVPARQGDQSAELLRRVTRFRDPTVLAGDFNSARDGALHVALRGPLTDAFEQGSSGLGATFHLLGWLPVRIDYVYVSDAFTVNQSRILPVDCSDHRPIVTDLTLTPVRR